MKQIDAPHHSLEETAEVLWNLLASLLAFPTTLAGEHTYIGKHN